MKLKDTIIAYNPGSAEIAVGPLLNDGDDDWAHPYKYTIGAVFSEVRDLNGMKASHRLMSDFIAVVVRDGVDLDAAHGAFCKIDEYRSAIPFDVPTEGANGNRYIKSRMKSLMYELDRRRDMLVRATKFLELNLPLTALGNLKDDLASISWRDEQNKTKT